MTFSFRPRRWSTVPWMEASVSTRVVSWKDAAEMNESVESEALVMPSSNGRPVAGRPPCAITRSFSSRKWNLSTCCSSRNARIAHVFDLHPAHHLANDHLDVLVADVDALQPVDFLDFVHQVSLQFFFAEHGENVVRVERTVHQRFARLDALAFLHVDVDAARHRVFFFGAVVGDRRKFCAGPWQPRRSLTVPSISLMTAVSCGLRASNNSTTRGRPPVMSLVLVVSRGILASTSPGKTVSPSCTIR